MTAVADGMKRSIIGILRLMRYFMRVYFLPLAVCLSAALIYLAPMSWVTEATRSALVVILMLILPGVVVMVLSVRERAHWTEYAMVWLLFVVAVPIYGAVLFALGYGAVLARAWRRKWPHVLQADEFDGSDGDDD